MALGISININELTFGENATFLHIKDGVSITNGDIDNMFLEASVGKIRNYPIDVRRQTMATCPDVRYSIRLFKSMNAPSFFVRQKRGWDEQKVGFILFIEYGEYVAIIKRNASTTKSIMEKLEVLSYERLLSLYVNSDTEFEKLSMYNMDGSVNAVRSKTYEANDLRENFSTVGASRFVLRTFRANNNGSKVAMALSSSRVNEFKNKLSIIEICNWAKHTIDDFIAVVPADTFLSVFATSISYKNVRNTLTPESILFFPNTLINGIQNATLSFEKKRKGVSVALSDQVLVRYLSSLTRTMDIVSTTDADGTVHYWVYREGKNTNVEVQLLANSIKVNSPVWRRIIVTDNATHNRTTLNSYINGCSEYNIYFENTPRIYTNNKLFEDTHLLGNIDYFLKVFQPVARLAFTDSEKGDVATTVTRFCPKSVFGVVEHYAINAHKYLVCDDFGTEWADHIGISEDRVSFYVSKHKESKCSASDFQDVVGQALKNLGNLAPVDAQLLNKIGKWGGTWNGTPLPRFRSTAGTPRDAVNLWKEAINHPYFKREMNLVVDFLSVQDMTTYLTNLKNGVSFGRKNEAYQLLWLLSSLIANCKQLDVDVHIYCKP